MNKRSIIVDAFVFAIQSTLNNLGLYFLSILTTIGIIITGTILLVGSYVLILAKQSSTFQELLRLSFAGKAITVIAGKAVATEQAMQMTKTVLAEFPLFMMILGVCLLILFPLILAAIMAGHIRMLLILHDTGKASMSDFFSALSLAPGLYVVNIISIIMVTLPPILIATPLYLVGLPVPLQVIGLVIAVILSIIIGAHVYLAQYFFIDDRETIIGSLRASTHLTKNHLFTMILVIIISLLLSANTTLILFSLFPFILMIVNVYRSLVPAEQSSALDQETD